MLWLLKRTVSTDVSTDEYENNLKKIEQKVGLS